MCNIRIHIYGYINNLILDKWECLRELQYDHEGHARLFVYLFHKEFKKAICITYMYMVDVLMNLYQTANLCYVNTGTAYLNLLGLFDCGYTCVRNHYKMQIGTSMIFI